MIDIHWYRTFPADITIGMMVRINDRPTSKVVGITADVEHGIVASRTPKLTLEDGTVHQVKDGDIILRPEPMEQITPETNSELRALIAEIFTPWTPANDLLTHAPSGGESSARFLIDALKTLRERIK